LAQPLLQTPFSSLSVNSNIAFRGLGNFVLAYKGTPVDGYAVIGVDHSCRDRRGSFWPCRQLSKWMGRAQLWYNGCSSSLLS
jgi:hypothetical protein